MMIKITSMNTMITLFPPQMGEDSLGSPVNHYLVKQYLKLTYFPKFLLSKWYIQVSPQMGEDSLGSPVREGTRTPTHAKRKASRKVMMMTMMMTMTMIRMMMMMIRMMMMMIRMRAMMMVMMMMMESNTQRKHYNIVDDVDRRITSKHFP